MSFVLSHFGICIIILFSTLLLLVSVFLVATAVLIKKSETFSVHLANVSSYNPNYLQFAPERLLLNLQPPNN